jgi:hypothetical protein
MDNVNHGIDLLVAVAADYAPTRVADGFIHLQKLELFVGLREVQATRSGAGWLFIAEITASARVGQRGITITCVGWQQEIQAAVTDAVARWPIGVLPVLAHWRGKHSCLVNSEPIETQGGPFELLAGPVEVRNLGGEEIPPAPAGTRFTQNLLDVLRNHRPAQRLHWLELYASKFNDGSVDATCRLDNRDWIPGQKVLLNVASSWPTVNLPLQSSRQFAMLVPQNGNPQEIVVPTFFSRLLGRA